MAKRVQREQAQPRTEEVADVQPKPAGGVDYDAILDEIDSVLEADAEEYVRSFVQKGGQ